MLPLGNGSNLTNWDGRGVGSEDSMRRENFFHFLQNFMLNADFL